MLVYPSKANAEFVCADVLAVYHRSYDADEILGCLDETSKHRSKKHGHL